MKPWVVLHKKVGETPLSCMETWREKQGPIYTSVPLTYAGRLDPLASGLQLVLIGETCKHKEQFLALDKAYIFSVLFGVQSDSADVLGIVSSGAQPTITKSNLEQAVKKLLGPTTLPYPVYSSKPVNGLPLHTWAATGRLEEIKIPTKTSIIHRLDVHDIKTLSKDEVYNGALAQIDSIPPVTELRKALGNDFRRKDVRASWLAWYEHTTPEEYQIATFTCIASSGTYMRTLAEEIARECESVGLAWSIERTAIGKYQPLVKQFGWWKRRYT